MGTSGTQDSAENYAFILIGNECFFYCLWRLMYPVVQADIVVECL